MIYSTVALEKLIKGWGQQNRKWEVARGGWKRSFSPSCRGIRSENYSSEFVLCQNKGPGLSRAQTLLELCKWRQMAQSSRRVQAQGRPLEAKNKDAGGTSGTSEQ